MLLVSQNAPDRGNEKERKAGLRVQILHTPTHNLLITRHNPHHPSWAPRTVYAVGASALLGERQDRRNGGYIGQTLIKRDDARR